MQGTLGGLPARLLLIGLPLTILLGFLFLLLLANDLSLFAMAVLATMRVSQGRSGDPPARSQPATRSARQCSSSG